MANLVTYFNKDYRVTVAYSKLDDEYEFLTSPIRSTLWEGSFGYKFPEKSFLKNLFIDTGYKFFKDNRVETQSYGLLTRYIVNF